MAVHPTVLLTGFGPFPGVRVNASSRLVRALARLCRMRIKDVRFVSDVLATDWHAAPARVVELLDIWSPDVVLHFGVSSGARGFVIEKVAHNRCGGELDVCGCTAPAGEVVGGGPLELHATLPGDVILARLREARVSACLSDDAGCYLCNAVLYRSLHVSTAGTPAISGFIHIPQELGSPGCRLSWRAALRGGMEIVDACVERARQQS